MDLLKIHCWYQQTTATALFYSGGQHQEMSLDRIFHMARSLAGKTVPLSNFPHERREGNFSRSYSFFFWRGIFWMFVGGGDPFSPHVAWLHSLAFTCIDKRQNSSNDRILGTLLQIFNWPRFYGPQKYPVPRHWIALKPHFVQEPQKIFSSAFPLIYRAQWCYLRALRTFLTVSSSNGCNLKTAVWKSYHRIF